MKNDFMVVPVIIVLAAMFCLFVLPFFDGREKSCVEMQGMEIYKYAPDADLENDETYKVRFDYFRDKKDYIYIYTIPIRDINKPIYSGYIKSSENYGN